MTAQRTAHEWSKDALFSKAQRYADIMADKNHSDWEFGFWSALTLEVLVRASIANISPALLADGKDWNNVLYAVGVEPNQQKFTPKSSDISDLLKRAESLFSSFTREMLNFSVAHINKRNSELHSGALPFDGAGSASWLPMFYSVCKVLVEEIGESLESLVGEDIAEEAEEHIQALEDESAKSVKGTINAHQTIWEEKPEEEREKLSKQAELLSTRHHGHRVACPACGSTALVQGRSTGAPKTTVDEDGIIEKQTMLPSSFECVACGLKIAGYSKLVACGLGNTYISTSHYDAVEYFDIDIESEVDSMMWEDNNEPF
ncbi:hypothetical protein [Marinobacter sp. MBR-105]